MSIGKNMLGRRHVLPSVPSMLTQIMVEGNFPSGTFLVTVLQPISSDDGDLEKALYGSFLPIPGLRHFPCHDPKLYEPEMQPGAIVVAKDREIILHEGKKRLSLRIRSKGDRPIQVCVP